ncbi:hypothetical protein ASG84_26040 [Rhodococcus sp. Leaf278]|uniref:hypothetical protein n=1 Tax=Rhodococcus sp. Leaf278 TaxID=1736319 RepID=UPI00070C676F|nr:hypothetical protein [Rhodococcus sp. Leaf278]KQU50521.1 hypothetical protein ASG84_26040 [Rhodococcus sp. Leaf278]
MSATEPRYPLARYWESRRVSGAEVHRMIDVLDPVDDVEITHLSMEVLTPPLFAYLGCASGFARTLGNPATADRAWRIGTGDQILKSAQRDLDTLTFFGEFIRRGHRSPEAQAVFNRIQRSLTLAAVARARQPTSASSPSARSPSTSCSTSRGSSGGGCDEPWSDWVTPAHSGPRSRGKVWKTPLFQYRAMKKGASFTR